MSGNGAPSEDDITLFCDVTGLNRSEASSRLRANNNDLNRATEEYFENPDSTKYKWDESQFSAGREGDYHNTSVSFNIQGPDELPSASYHGSTAPTRPPSRTNNRSPLVEGAPTNHAEEDAALQRALVESAAESGIPPQETGVVDTDSTVKYFGPANRSEYDTAQWAMVPTKATTEITNTDSKPSMRKRLPGAPAFIRQTKDCRLGSLLSIYHKIPLVRNIFLSFPSSARTYGHNSEWWKGQPILKPEALAAMMREEADSGDDGHPAFGEELHRLMAFLDRTERSYGTVDALVETDAIDPSRGRNTWGVDYEAKFLDQLIEEHQSNTEFDATPMVHTGQQFPPAASSMANESWDDSESYDNEQNSASFALLDLTLIQQQWAWVNSLYDALDELLWANAISADQSSSENDSTTAVLVRPAEVVTIRFNGPGLQRPCEIPATFYADRYMEINQELARHFQCQIREIRNGLQKLTRWEGRRGMCKGELGCSRYVWLGQPHDIRTCRTKIIATFEILIEQQRKNAQWRYYENRWHRDIPYSMNDLRLVSTWSGPYELTAEEEANKKRWDLIVQTAKNELEQLDQDMKVFQEKKGELLDQLDVISKRLTCQEHEADDERFVYRSDPEAYHPEYWNPSQKYSLRGVALTTEVSYVCVRGESDLIDMGEGSKPNDQWWKIEYSSNGSSPATTEKVSLDDVLQAAGTGSKWPILVYATEKALETTPIPLSDPLRMFVKADNRSFQQELAQEQSQEQTPQESMPPSAAVITDDALSRIPVASSAKRKHSASSSVATNGSSRSDLNDIDLTFSDDRNAFSEDSGPVTSHQEFANSSPQSNKLGGIVESLANCQTNEESPSKHLGKQTHFVDDGPIVEMKETSTTPTPEMQERTGGPTPFFSTRAGDNNTTSGTIDSMDMDIDSDHQDSQP